MAMEDSFSFRDILVDLDLQNIEWRWREKREKERMKKNEKKKICSNHLFDHQGA